MTFKKTKQKSNKKSSVSRWFQTLSATRKSLLFLSVFAVIGGGFAVYKSYAYSWTQIVDNQYMTVSVCTSYTSSGHYFLKFAVYNKMTVFMVDLYGINDVDPGIIVKKDVINPVDIIVMPGNYMISAKARSWRFGFESTYGDQNFTANVNPSSLVRCGGGK